MSMFGNMDLGPQGGDYAGFVSWTSQGSDDGSIPRRSFSISTKDANGQNHRSAWQAPMQGVALDIRKLRIGWEKNEQNMPKPHRVLVPAGQAFPASPGEGYKKAFSVPVTSGDGNVFLWEQGGVTSFSALEHLVPQLAQQEGMNPGKVPVVQFTGTSEMSIQGKMLGAAQLTVVQWVDPVQFFGADASAVGGMTGNTGGQQAQGGGFGGGQQQQQNSGGGFGGQQQQQQQPAQNGFGGQQQPAQGGFGGQQGGGFGGGDQGQAQQPGAFAGGPVGQAQPEF